MDFVLFLVLVVVVVGLVIASQSVKIVNEFERGVLFRLGRVIPTPKGPGPFLLIPMVDRMRKVNLQTVTLNVPAQDVITRDNVTVRVDAVVFFRIVEPVLSQVKIENVRFATSQVCQTTLRSVCGTADLDQLLSERVRLNNEIEAIVDGVTEEWGVKVANVELKDVSLPESIQRAMARQAEAERERRAKIINAEGEFQAAQRLADAAEVIAKHPTAYQLRMLQTITEVAAERNSTLVLPFPIELLAHFRAAATSAAPVGGDGAQTEAASTPRDSGDE